MTTAGSRTSAIRMAAERKDRQAEAMLSDLLIDLFNLKPHNLEINRDQYSLNSLNGFFDSDEGDFFFKFHQEEGEEDMSGEYYRANILADAGLPVDQPLFVSDIPGEQILVYRRRTDPRFSDVLLELDIEDIPALRASAVAAESRLSARVLQVYERTLHPITLDQVRNEPINRLFYDRLVDAANGAYPGGRLKRFYIDKLFKFPGATLHWDDFSNARLVVNGIEYQQTIKELFDGAHMHLEPSRLLSAGGVVAHGDAHNANVWYEIIDGEPNLSLFDPAFAGDHCPTLLAEVKTTFHNVFAHPLWLYGPVEAESRFTAEAHYSKGMLSIDTDWELSPIREELLAVKAKCVWQPLLQTLKERNLLPADWRKIARYALFLCPTLVMNLRAGEGHNPISSLIGFANAVRTGSEPVSSADTMTDFFDRVTPK